MLNFKAPFVPFIKLLLAVMFVMGGIGSVKGQRVYATANLTTIIKIPGAGGDKGIGIGVKDGAIGSADIFNPNNINGSVNANPAELTGKSGAPGTGLGAKDGLASSTSLTIDFPETSYPKLGDTIYIKATLESAATGLLTNSKDLVTFQAYNGTNPVGSLIKLSALNTNSSGNYIFKATGDLKSIRITSTTDAGYVPILGILGGVSTSSLKLYYAYYIPPPTLVNSNPTICSGSQVNLAVNNPDPTLTYKWYTAATGGTLVNTGSTYAPILSSNTSYYVQANDGANTSLSRTPVSVTINPLPTLTAAPSETTVATGTSVTLNATTNGTSITWYDHNGVNKFTGTSYNLGVQNTPGSYVYTAVSNNGTCTNSTLVKFSVYSPTQCPDLNERIYATGQIPIGSVTTPEKAADGDPKTSSSLSPLLDLLGLFAPTQSLTWSSTVTAGTPLVVKLGPDPGLLSLASGISIVGLKLSGGVYTEIGTPETINISLLNLLSGENSFEYSYIPKIGLIPQDYNGIKIVFSSLLGIGKSIKVFDAYYLKPISSVDCTKKDVVDILYGAEAPLAIGAATVGVNVANPWNAVDGDIDTYTTLNAVVAVAAYAKEHIIFSSPSLKTDSLKIITSANGTLLTLGLLGGFSIQRYLGGSQVGAPIPGSNFSLLNIKLLDGGTKATIMLLPTPEPYDRIEIRLGGTVGLLNSININEVYRVADTKVTGSNSDNQISVCEGQSVFLPDPTNDCTTFEWYDETGVKINSPSTKGLELNTTGYSGTKKFYVQPVRYGCNKFMSRGTVTVTISPALTTPTASAAPVCTGSNGVFAATTISGLTYNWYEDAIGGIPIYTGAVYTTTTPPVNGKTYYVEATNGICTSPRVAISIIVKPLPNLSSVLTPHVCSGSIFNYTAIPNIPLSSISWTRNAIIGINNTTNTGNSTNINETLINTTLNPIDVTYVFTLSASNGCSNIVSMILRVYTKPSQAHITSQ